MVAVGISSPASDLLDVYDFVWTTLRPAAFKRLSVVGVDARNPLATAADSSILLPHSRATGPVRTLHGNVLVRTPPEIRHPATWSKSITPPGTVGRQGVL